MTEDPLTPSTHDIGARARTAVGWRALSQFSSQGIQIVVGIILARLLMPSDFGIIGMAGIVTGLAGVFQDLGFGQALVQRAELRPEHSRSAFWMTLIMGTLLYTALYFGAPWAGEYFRDDRMVPVLRLMALSFLISPFGVVPRSLLQRELDFRKPFYAGLAGTIANGGVGITMAFLGYGYWSLVWALLVSSAVGTIALCIVTRYAPPVVPSLRGARELFAFGGGMTAISLLHFMREKADYFMIGRQMDVTALGLYTRAYGQITLPITVTAHSVHGIMFAALSRLQTQPERLRKAFCSALTAVAAVAFPLEGMLLVTSAELIPAVFGQQWTGSVRSVQILTLAGFAMVVGNMGGAAMTATGRVKLAVWMQGIEAFLLPAAAYSGSRWGIVGVSIGVTAVHCLMLPIRLLFVKASTGLEFQDFAIALRGPTIATVLACVGAAAARQYAVAAQWGDWSTLMLTVGVGACLLALTYVFSPLPEFRDVVRDITAHYLPRKATA